MAKYNLALLFRKRGKEHINIDTAYKSVTEIDVFPNVLFHAKLVIMENVQSPTTIKFCFDNDVPMDDIDMYSSFKVTHPNRDSKNIEHHKNPTKLVLHDPKGKLKFAEVTTFYMTFETTFRSATLQI